MTNINCFSVENRYDLFLARSLPIAKRVEQRTAGRAVREGGPNQLWSRIRLPAKHSDPAHNRGKSFNATSIPLCLC